MQAGGTQCMLCFSQRKKDLVSLETIQEIGSAGNPPYIYTGFKPAFVMLKEYFNRKWLEYLIIQRDTIMMIMNIYLPNLSNAESLMVSRNKQDSFQMDLKYQSRQCV